MFRNYLEWQKKLTDKSTTLWKYRRQISFFILSEFNNFYSPLIHQKINFSGDFRGLVVNSLKFT